MDYRAPQGCAQMYFDNVNTIKSFNWDGNSGRSGTNGGILASQDYKICIKQNKGTRVDIVWKYFSTICGQTKYDVLIYRY